MNRPLKWFLVALFAFTGIYSAYQARFLIGGPKIVLETPQNGATVANEEVTIRGSAENIAKLYLNGEQIFTDSNGHFQEELLLAYGYNVLELRAEDRFGRDRTKTLSVIFK